MRVMIVEDEVIARRVIVSIVKRFRQDYEVVEFECIEKALKCVKKKHFDIVITDVEVSKQNGIEMIKKMKKISTEINFVIISGYPNFEYAQKAIKLNVVDYILKPIDPDEVCRAIKIIEDVVEKKSKYHIIAENSSKEIKSVEDKQEINPLENILDYIQNNYKKDISLDVISEIFYFNASYLSILFKRNVGCNFISYLTTLRMEEAKRLAKETNMKINEICKEVGYKDYKYFCVIFKKHYKMTPNEFRRANIKINRDDGRYDKRNNKIV